jgi:hypothetical protein
MRRRYTDPAFTPANIATPTEQNLKSIISHLRNSWEIDTPEEQCGTLCGRRWANSVASADQLKRLAVFYECPGFTSWFDGEYGAGVITPERLVEIIHNSKPTSAECVQFWSDNFGNSERHVWAWRTPEFTRGFVAGAVGIWKQRIEACCADIEESCP